MDEHGHSIRIISTNLTQSHLPDCECVKGTSSWGLAKGLELQNRRNVEDRLRRKILGTEAHWLVIWLASEFHSAGIGEHSELTSHYRCGTWVAPTLVESLMRASVQLRRVG